MFKISVCTWHSCQCPWYWDVLCRCACIVDCFEIYIENLKARSETYSNYKHCYTMKWKECGRNGKNVKVIVYFWHYLCLFWSIMKPTFWKLHLCLYILGLLVTDGGTFLNGLKCHNCWHFHVEGFWMDTYHYFDDHIFNLDSLSTNSFSN